MEPEIEYSAEKPNEYYTENEYVVKQRHQNKEVSDYVLNEDLQVLWGTLFSLGILGVEIAFLFLLNHKNSIHSLKEEIKDKKKELQETKQFLLENKVSMENLKAELVTLREHILKRYDGYALAIEEDREITKRIHSLKQENMKRLED